MTPAEGQVWYWPEHDLIIECQTGISSSLGLVTLFNGEESRRTMWYWWPELVYIGEL